MASYLDLLAELLLGREVVPIGEGYWFDKATRIFLKAAIEDFATCVVATQA